MSEGDAIGYHPHFLLIIGNLTPFILKNPLIVDC